MSSIVLLLAAISITCCLQAISSWMRQRRLKKYLPPSPSGIPFVGNMFQMPKVEPWRTFSQWKEDLGPVFSLNMAGQHIIVINTLEAVSELLDRRSSVYSDRPRSIVNGEIVCRGNNVGMMEYGPKWRRMRRAVHDTLHIRAVQAYASHQERDAAALISSLLEDPDEWSRHFAQAGASAAYSVVYGEYLHEKHHYTSIVQRVNEFVRTTAAISLPTTALLVEFFPWMASWYELEAMGTDVARGVLGVVEGWMDGVKTKNYGAVRSSLAARLIERSEKYGLNEEENVWLAAILFVVGSETTAGALMVFLLAMVLHPDVMKRAQNEVDATVGRERLPSFEDQDNLPYINAIVKETLRWFSGVPLGLPRRCMQDDWYEGYLIPKGSIIIANTWAISKDPRYFPNPEEFLPERYLDGGEGNSKMAATALEMNFVFGFGRRICPGKNYAYRSLFIMIASMIWAFDIHKAKDGEGNDITPSSTECVDDGIVVRPVLFPCQILPRDNAVRTVVEKTQASVS